MHCRALWHCQVCNPYCCYPVSIVRSPGGSAAQRKCSTGAHPPPKAVRTRHQLTSVRRCSATSLAAREARALWGAQWAQESMRASAGTRWRADCRGPRRSALPAVRRCAQRPAAAAHLGVARERREELGLPACNVGPQRRGAPSVLPGQIPLGVRRAQVVKQPAQRRHLQGGM